MGQITISPSYFVAFSYERYDTASGQTDYPAEIICEEGLNKRSCDEIYNDLIEFLKYKIIKKPDEGKLVYHNIFGQTTIIARHAIIYDTDCDVIFTIGLYGQTYYRSMILHCLYNFAGRDNIAQDVRAPIPRIGLYLETCKMLDNGTMLLYADKNNRLKGITDYSLPSIVDVEKYYNFYQIEGSHIIIAKKQYINWDGIISATNFIKRQNRCKNEIINDLSFKNKSVIKGG